MLFGRRSVAGPSLVLVVCPFLLAVTDLLTLYGVGSSSSGEKESFQPSTSIRKASAIATPDPTGVPIATWGSRALPYLEARAPQRPINGNKHFITPFVVVLRFIRPPPSGATRPRVSGG